MPLPYTNNMQKNQGEIMARLTSSHRPSEERLLVNAKGFNSITETFELNRSTDYNSIKEKTSNLFLPGQVISLKSS